MASGTSERVGLAAAHLLDPTEKESSPPHEQGHHVDAILFTALSPDPRTPKEVLNKCIE